MKRNTSEREARTPRLPRFALIFYAIAVASAILFVIFLCSKKFSDFFNRYISSFLRGVLAHLTSWIPFSVAEFLLLLLIPIIVLLAIFGIRKYSDTWRNVGIYCASLLSVVALVFSLFTVGFAPGFRHRWM